MRKLPIPKPRAPLTSIVVGYPMQLVAVDIVGPFPETAAGNCYILVAADYFTRWVEAYPIHNQEATIVARKLVSEFFFRFSPPERLHSDQGRNFESAVILEVCKLLGIAKSRTIPYHSQCDGLVERFNRTLLNMLPKAVHERPFEWDEHVQQCAPDNWVQSLLSHVREESAATHRSRLWKPRVPVHHAPTVCGWVTF